MKSSKTFTLIVVIGLITGCYQAVAQTVEELLPKAIQLEEVKGNLDEAIKAYQVILNKFSGNRDVCAKALLHLGMCYEKLGSEKAGQAYRQLIKEYAGNKEEVSVARDRLAKIEQALAGMKNKPTFRKIEIATKPKNGVLSPDGKKLAFTSENSLWMVPLQGNVGTNIAGEPVQIAEVIGASNKINVMVWSADGRYMAVNDLNNNEDYVYIIPVNGGEQRKIKMPARNVGKFSYHLSLSPDGDKLVFSSLAPGLKSQNELSPIPAKTDVLHVYKISTAGGEPVQVSSGPGIAPSYSRDGKFIAYVNMYEKEKPSENATTPYESELWVANSSTGSSVRLAVAEGVLRWPVWSPDGRYIASPSRAETGASEISIYPVSPDATVAGEATVIKLPSYSTGLLAGWTPSDEIGVFIYSKIHNVIYTVPSSGGKAMQVSADANVYYPRWSPDGKRIYLRLVNEDNNPDVQIAYVSAYGGEIKKIHWVETPLMSSVPGGGHNLSPDGRKIIVHAVQKPYNVQSIDLWVVPAEGGQYKRLTNDDSYEMYPCWSPDGKWIAYIEWQKSTSTDAKNFDVICRIPSDGGTPVPVTSENDSVGRGSVAFTPDGKGIAFFSGNAIRTIPVEGGKSEVLLSGVKFNHSSRLAWSPDYSKLAYNFNGKIYITTLATGDRTELKTGLPDECHADEFDWSPDGRKIVFKSTSGKMEPEFWLVSNFLPPEKN